MTHRPLILLLVAVYLIVLWVIRRRRLVRARARGISPRHLARFDHKGFLDELRDLYLAGNHGGVGFEESDRACHSSPAADPILGAPPAWLDPGPWGPNDPSALPEVVARAKALMEASGADEVDRLVEDGQDPVVDQALASLGIHHFVHALYSGNLDGAEAQVKKLPTWTRDRISWRTVEKHLAQLAYLRAETKAEGRARNLRLARKLIRRAGGGGRFADAGTRALWAHLSLLGGINPLIEVFTLLRVDHVLRVGLAENRSSALLYYELAHCCLWRARFEEAVDHLARALYFGGGDPFYSRPIVEAPEIAGMKPSLVKQALGKGGLEEPSSAGTA